MVILNNNHFDERWEIFHLLSVECLVIRERMFIHKMPHCVLRLFIRKLKEFPQLRDSISFSFLLHSLQFKWRWMCPKEGYFFFWYLNDLLILLKFGELWDNMWTNTSLLSTIRGILHFWLMKKLMQELWSS